MAKKKFQPNDWLQNNKHNSTNEFPTPSGVGSTKSMESNISGDNQANDILETISRIESKSTDIAPNYADWRDLGFALSDQFGDQGRDYFHRLSRFYSGYSAKECDSQYTKCLKARGHGITIKTFFHLAKKSGIDISSTNVSPPGEMSVGQRGFSSGHTERSRSAAQTPPKTNKDPSPPPGEMSEGQRNQGFKTPTLPPQIYTNLPEILKESTALFEDPIEKDVFLIGAISTLSGCLPNIQGIYFDEPYTAHLYAFITAPAASGKGKLKWAKYYGLAIHQEMLNESNNEKDQFKQDTEHYQNLNKTQKQNAEKPEKPPFKMFFIPANSSSSAFIQALADTDFHAVIFETEADTLASTFKQEWGNFSDILRKAFHHETTSMFRRKDNEYIEIKDPHLAIALSGTPHQVRNLMPDVENGLFSRFLYYAFEDTREFKNPFVSHSKVNYTDFFKEHSNHILDLNKQLKLLQMPVEFKLTDKQGEEFTTRLREMLNRNKLLLGSDFDASVKRLGIITFRIAMIFSALRILEDGMPQDHLHCLDEDFSTALSITATLEKHAIAVYQYLPGKDIKGIKLKFLQALPKHFNRQKYLEVAGKLNINTKTAEKYLGQFRKTNLINHEHNQYTKSDYAP